MSPSRIMFNIACRILKLILAVSKNGKGEQRGGKCNWEADVKPPL